MKRRILGIIFAICICLGGSILSVAAQDTIDFSVLDSCEVAGPVWSGALPTDDCKVGSHAIYANGSDVIAPQTIMETPVQTSGLTVENAQVSFWMKVNDLTRLDTTAGWFCISSGGEDANCYRWMVADAASGFAGQIKSEWTLVVLDVADATVEGNAPDLNAVNFIRIVLKAKEGELIAYFDEFAISNRDLFDPTEPLPEPVPYVSLSGCDDSWNSGRLDTEDKKVGYAAVSGTSSGLVDMATTVSMGKVSGFTEQNSRLVLWFYISDVSLLFEEDMGHEGGWIEAASTNVMDREGYKWYFTSMRNELQNGWNRLVLSFNNTDQVNGSPDINDLKLIRVLVASTGGEITVKVDDILLLNTDLAGVDDIRYVEVAYDGNGADEGSLGNLTLLVGSSVPLNIKAFGREGYVLAGWSLTADGAALEELILTPEMAEAGSLKLYAVWAPMDSLKPDETAPTYEVIVQGGCGSQSGGALIWLGLGLTAVSLGLVSLKKRKEDQ